MQNIHSDVTSKIPSIDEISLKNLLKNPTRMQIFFLLFFYPELNVSDIAQKIHSNKATVSRHLLALEQAHILDSRISQYKRSITPKYYRLSISSMMELLPSETRSMRNIPKNPQDRLKYYKKSVNAIRTAMFLTQQGIGLLEPLLEQMDGNLGNIVDVDQAFQKNFESELEKKIDFQTIVLSESLLPEYYRLWMKFRNEVEQLEKKNRTDHSYIVFETVLPFQKLIEFQNNSTNKE